MRDFSRSRLVEDSKHRHDVLPFRLHDEFEQGLNDIERTLKVGQSHSPAHPVDIAH